MGTITSWVFWSVGRFDWSVLVSWLVVVTVGEMVFGVWVVSYGIDLSVIVLMVSK